MIVAGIGCRSTATPDCVQAALTAALRQSGRILGEIACLATLPSRSTTPALRATAAMLGVDLITVPEAELLAAAGQCLTDSPRARAATGLPSVAEAAALAAAGPGARLLAPRSAAGGATCALAEVRR